MKASFKYAALLLMVTGLLSCVKSTVDPVKDPDYELIKPAEKVLSAEEQGEKLTNVALNFMGRIKSDDFSKAVELINKLEETDFEKYETEENEELVQNLIDKVQTCQETAGIDKWLYNLNGARGKYVAKNGKITSSTSNDFELQLEDDYYVKATFSEKVNRLLVTTHKYLYTSSDKPNDKYYYADVPESIELVVKYKGDQLLKVKMEASFNLHAEFDEFDSKQDAFAVSLSVNLCDYCFSLEKASYKSGTAQLNMSISKGSTCLLSEKATVNGIKTVGGQASNIDDAKLDIDILGMVQIAISSPDVIAIVDGVQEVGDIVNKTDAKRVAKTITDNISAQIFYNSDVPQASLGFEPTTCDSDQTRWTIMPVIVIGDQTYGISDYQKILSDSNMEKIISSFESLCNQFEQLVADI